MVLHFLLKMRYWFDKLSRDIKLVVGNDAWTPYDQDDT
jgi:hypothetical protein